MQTATSDIPSAAATAARARINKEIYADPMKLFSRAADEGLPEKESNFWVKYIIILAVCGNSTLK